jgi:Sulfotransferase family
VRVLVVGHPRSATTWLGKVLGATAGTSYVAEPDLPKDRPFAVRALAGRGNLPVLAADDTGSRSLERLWDVAFGRRTPRFVPGQGRLSTWLLRGASEEELDRMRSTERHFTLRLRLVAACGVPAHTAAAMEAEHHVVKSVHAPLMIEWIRARWDPVVVVCFRHPLDVVASAVEARIAGGSAANLMRLLTPETRAVGTDHYGVPLPSGDDQAPYVAWRVGLVMSALDDACRDHPEFHVVDHEQVCANPVDRLRELVDAVGLTWTADTEAFVTESNRPGTTWTTNRIASELPGRWRTRLTPEQARSAADVLRQFPIAARYASELDV